MAQTGRHRLLPIPRGADQRSGTRGLPVSCHRSLAADASAARPEAPDDMAADRKAGRRLAPQTAHPSSLAKPTLRRQTPKVGAVCGKAARTVLCGGRSVMRVPTAILNLRSPQPAKVPTVSLKRIRVPHHMVVPTLLVFGVATAFLTTEPWLTLTVVGIVYVGSSARLRCARPSPPIETSRSPSRPTRHCRSARRTHSP